MRKKRKWLEEGENEAAQGSDTSFFAIVIKTLHRSAFSVTRKHLLINIKLFLLLLVVLVHIEKWNQPSEDHSYGRISKRMPADWVPATSYQYMHEIMFLLSQRNAYAVADVLKFIVLNNTMLVVYQFHCLAGPMNENTALHYSFLVVPIEFSLCVALALSLTHTNILLLFVGPFGESTCSIVHI